jgi:hypothetical protein
MWEQGKTASFSEFSRTLDGSSLGWWWGGVDNNAVFGLNDVLPDPLECVVGFYYDPDDTDSDTNADIETSEGGVPNEIDTSVDDNVNTQRVPKTQKMNMKVHISAGSGSESSTNLKRIKQQHRPSFQPLSTLLGGPLSAKKTFQMKPIVSATI